MNFKSTTLATVLVAVGIAGFAYAEPAITTKGPIPEDARANGKLDLSRVPDYVIAWDHNGGIAGYVRKEDLFGKENGHHNTPVVVFDESLKRHVGQMVPGRGFVPSGARAESVPGFETRAEAHDDTEEGDTE
jgi:hypothetical protein